VDGSDLSGLVRGDTDEGAGSVYLQFEAGFFGQTEPERFWRAIRHGQWKYSENLAQGPFQLFNLETDPYEMHNLVDDPTHGSVRGELRRRMVAKAQEIGDDFFQRSTGDLLPRPADS